MAQIGRGFPATPILQARPALAILARHALVSWVALTVPAGAGGEAFSVELSGSISPAGAVTQQGTKLLAGTV